MEMVSVFDILLENELEKINFVESVEGAQLTARFTITVVNGDESLEEWENRRVANDQRKQITAMRIAH